MANTKVVKMRRTGSVAKVLFVIFILYILIFGIITFSKKAEKTYEVHSGSLSADNAYRGFIIRNEEVVNSEYAGNVNYYVHEDTRVKKGDTIYTVDETGRVAALLEEINNGENSLAKDDIADIKSMLNMYKSNYESNNFGAVYNLKTDINSTILRASNRMLIDNLDTLIDKTGSANLFQMVSATKTGIVEYSIDGYEDVTLDSFEPSMLDSSNYKSENLYMQDITVKGNPVYRLVTDEVWYIVFELSKDDIDRYQLNNKSAITVNFKKNKIKVTTGFSLMNRDGKTYGVLELKDYMVRFAGDRYVDFEISTTSYEGLKLPVSAITELNFFVVPVE
ncbi:MAG: HlyD family efflux transporter periplasmic adaptor subunit, partial [Lachnospiraceae bacterium]